MSIASFFQTEELAKSVPQRVLARLGRLLREGGDRAVQELVLEQTQSAADVRLVLLAQAAIEPLHELSLDRTATRFDLLRQPGDERPVATPLPVVLETAQLRLD